MKKEMSEFEAGTRYVGLIKGIKDGLATIRLCRKHFSRNPGMYAFPLINAKEDLVEALILVDGYDCGDSRLDELAGLLKTVEKYEERILADDGGRKTLRNISEMYGVELPRLPNKYRWGFQQSRLRATA